MVFPMIPSFVYLKSALLAAALLGVVYDWLTLGCLRLDLRICLWTIGLSLMGFCFVIEGLFRSAPGAVKMIPTHVMWPIAYAIWIAAFTRKRLLIGLHRVLIFSTLCIGVYGILYLLTNLSIIPDVGVVSALSFGWEPQDFSAADGYTFMQFAGLNSLPFLLPYVLAWLAVGGAAGPRGYFDRIVSWAAAGLGLVVVVASSRRALLLLVIITPLLILVFRSFEPVRERVRDRRRLAIFFWTLVLAGAVSCVAVGFTYQYDIRSFWERFISAFDLSASSSDESGGGAVRHQQFLALLHGWSDYPIFGAGHGATASPYGSIRSESEPWAYELCYMALLFQTGVVGLAAYVAAIAWLFRRGLRVIREGGELGRLMIAMLVGLSGALVAHGTNPYIGRFDGVGMIFLPLAVINYRLCLFGPDGSPIQWFPEIADVK
jgi:hypothetical protein